MMIRLAPLGSVAILTLFAWASGGSTAYVTEQSARAGRGLRYEIGADGRVGGARRWPIDPAGRGLQLIRSRLAIRRGLR